MGNCWKPNWAEAKEHFDRWWKREGFILADSWTPVAAARPHDIVDDPGPPVSLDQRYADADWRARATRYAMSRRCLAGDIPPLANTDIGPGSLATMLGSPPGFSQETVWYNAVIDDPEGYGAVTFDPRNHWWQVHEAIIEANLAAAEGNYFVACPDLVENIDTLASLRGSERLLMDMVLRPEWVENKVAEINHAFFEVYQRIYDLISDDDGGACWGAFTLWAPGKLAKVQCDACAMFSPAMFARFVAPAMTAQCEWLDYSIYHLDGSQCIVHLDQLLAIEALDAIEWTPEPGVPHGGDPHWYPMYRRILDAGKSLQIVDIRQGDVIPMLEMLGSKGIYFGVNDFENEEQVVALTEAVRRYR